MAGMKQTIGRRAAIGGAVLWGVLCLAPILRAADADRAAKVLDGFVQSCRENESLSDQQRQQALETVASLRSDADFRDAAIAEALRVLSPEFAQALEALGEENLPPAVEALRRLAESDDRYLAAESTFFLTRAYLMEERFEEALPLLTRLAGEWADWSLHAGEALFLRGIAESRLLKRKDAIATLETFLKEYPDAPERMRVGAWRHKELLQLIEDGSISDVQEHMEFSRRRLTLADSGKTTQKIQDDIIEMLNKLIKEAEEQEQSGQGQGSGSKSQGSGEGQPGQGEGQQGEGQGQRGNTGGAGQSSEKALRRTHDGGQRTAWGDLRKKVENPHTFAALKEKFPGRYRQLIEQYYRSFQEQER